MYREIITADAPTYQFKISKEMLGKRIEILAFEITKETKKQEVEKTSNLTTESFFSTKRINLSNFKFNREEANDYE